MTAFSAPFDYPNKSKHFNDFPTRATWLPLALEASPTSRSYSTSMSSQNEPIGQITAAGRLRARSARGYWQMFGSSQGSPRRRQRLWNTSAQSAIPSRSATNHDDSRSCARFRACHGDRDAVRGERGGRPFWASADA